MKSCLHQRLAPLGATQRVASQTGELPQGTNPWLTPPDPTDKPADVQPEAKRHVTYSLLWTAVIIMIFCVAIWYIMEHRVQGMSREERAERMGFSLGILAAVGYGLIWLPYCARIGKTRRAERLAKRARRNQSQDSIDSELN